jgi:dGTPase
VVFSAQFRPAKNEFQAALMERLYRHHRVMRMTGKSERFVEDMFNEFIKRNGETMPPAERQRVVRDGLVRVAADYVAGMTDRYAQETYKQLFYPFERT